MHIVSSAGIQLSYVHLLRRTAYRMTIHLLRRASTGINDKCTQLSDSQCRQFTTSNRDLIDPRATVGSSSRYYKGMIAPPISSLFADKDDRRAPGTQRLVVARYSTKSTPCWSSQTRTLCTTTSAAT